MKQKIILTLTVLTFIAFLTGCGSSSSPTTKPVTIADVTLTANQSTVCTNATSFTVTPTGNPTVTFSTDASSGDTTITIDSNSTGSVVIVNCTAK